MGRYYAVQDFGRPKSAVITFKVSDRTDTPVTYTIDGQTFAAGPGQTITYERSRPPELRFAWNTRRASRKPPGASSIRPVAPAIPFGRRRALSLR